MRRARFPAWSGGGLLAVCLGVALVASGHEILIEGEIESGSEVLSDVHCHDEHDGQGSHAGPYGCWNVDLLAWIPLGVFGQGQGNDIWGWTDPRTGGEYAIIGLDRGVAFVDVSDPHHPVHLGVLPSRTGHSIWNDIKVYRDHAFIVSEARGHGMQVFDLTRLADVVDPPVVFEPTAHYAGFGSAHNLALDEETGFAYAVGSNTCNAGLHMVDVSRPTEPVFAGCFGGDGYTHDAECVVYHGPDTEHLGREICFNSNEDTLTIVDVTEKQAPVLLSRTSYAGHAYTHQGWLTEDHAHFFLGDELDELFRGHRTRTYVWDVTDLDAPFVSSRYTGPTRAIDHNMAVRGNHLFQANYRSGLRVLRMGDLRRGELVEVGFFDTLPKDDAAGFAGAWGVFPFFESGIVVVSDINRGLFVLGPDLGAVPECSDGLDNDLDGLVDHPDDPGCADPDAAQELPRNDVAIDVALWSADDAVPGWGFVPVAVLGSETFDVAAIDPDTLALGPRGAAPLGGRGGFRWDVDRDGFDDWISIYWTRQTGLGPADVEACLAWQDRDGVPYADCDAVRVVPRP